MRPLISSNLNLNYLTFIAVAVAFIRQSACLQITIRLVVFFFGRSLSSATVHFLLLLSVGVDAIRIINREHRMNGHTSSTKVSSLCLILYSPEFWSSHANPKSTTKSIPKLNTMNFSSCRANGFNNILMISASISGMQ